MVKVFQKFLYETRLKRLGIYSLNRQRLRGYLIETFKILTKKECLDCSGCFELAYVSSRLRWHLLKLLKPRCRTTVRPNFFSLRVISEWNKLLQKVVEATHSRTDWTNTGTIWASSADQPYSPLTTSIKHIFQTYKVIIILLTSKRNCWRHKWKCFKSEFLLVEHKNFEWYLPHNETSTCYKGLFYYYCYYCYANM